MGSESKISSTSYTLRHWTAITLFGVTAFILMNIQIPFLPPPGDFLKYDPSDIPILIIGFAYGPLAGFASLIVKTMLYGILRFQLFELIGLPLSFIASSCMLLVSSGLYLKHKTHRQAVLALGFGVLVTCLVMTPLNYFMMPYFFESFLQQTIAQDKLEAIVLYGVLPYNFCKYSLNGFLTYVVYKKTSLLLKSLEENV